MEKLVESLSTKLNLSSKYTIKEVLILSIQERTVLYSSGIDSPSDKAQSVWHMWQSATQFTDVAADHLIQIKAGGDQKMIYENDEHVVIENLRFEGTKNPSNCLESVADIVQIDPNYEKYIDTPIMRDSHCETPPITEAMLESLRKAPSRLNDRPIKAAILKANLEAVQKLPICSPNYNCGPSPALGACFGLIQGSLKKFVISMAGRPWYIQAMDATHRLTVLGILGGSGYLTYVAFRGIQHNKSRKELKQQITPEEPSQ